MTTPSQNFAEKNFFQKYPVLLKYGSLVAISTVIGILSAGFVLAMNFTIHIFEFNRQLIWCLPLFGLLTGWVYQTFAKDSINTTRLIHTLRLPHPITKLKNGVLIFFAAILSQLFGASTGREGAALQIAASVADPLWRKDLGYRREDWLRFALASGFGGVFNAPFAGACFAIEVQRSHKPLRLLPEVLFASFLSKHLVSLFVNHESIYPQIANFSWSLRTSLALIVFAVALASIGLGFNISTHWLQKKITSRWPLLAPMAAGFFMITLSQFILDFRYSGLGTNLITLAMNNLTRNYDFAFKSIATIVNTGLGLKGGEVMPLLSIGASFGNSFFGWIHNFEPLNNVQIWAAIGAVSLFCGSAQIPITACFLTLDLFGSSTILPAFVASMIVSRLVGSRGLYSEL